MVVYVIYNVIIFDEIEDNTRTKVPSRLFYLNSQNYHVKYFVMYTRSL